MGGEKGAGGKGGERENEAEKTCPSRESSGSYAFANLAHLMNSRMGEELGGGVLQKLQIIIRAQETEYASQVKCLHECYAKQLEVASQICLSGTPPYPSPPLAPSSPLISSINTSSPPAPKLLPLPCNPSNADHALTKLPDSRPPVSAFPSDSPHSSPPSAIPHTKEPDTPTSNLLALVGSSNVSTNQIASNSKGGLQTNDTGKADNESLEAPIIGLDEASKSGLGLGSGLGPLSGQPVLDELIRTTAPSFELEVGSCLSSEEGSGKSKSDLEAANFSLLNVHGGLLSLGPLSRGSVKVERVPSPAPLKQGEKIETCEGPVSSSEDDTREEGKGLSLGLSL